MRLKACQFIEGTPDGVGVTVNINQTSNVATLSPGYVIRLPASKARAIEQEPAP